MSGDAEFRRCVCAPAGEKGHVRARVPLPREAPLFKSHQEVSVQSPLARWPRPVPAAGCGEPLPGLGSVPPVPTPALRIWEARQGGPAALRCGDRQ